MNLYSSKKLSLEGINIIMKITEVTQPSEQALFEAIDASNDTGFLTEDLVKIGKAHNGQWSDPVDVDEMMRIVESWTK
jgi:hypothetical protein